jgi:hypothetical protein
MNLLLYLAANDLVQELADMSKEMTEYFDADDMWKQIKTSKVSKSAATACSVSWYDIAWVINWTLENARHLEPDDKYLIEKEIDRCHLELMHFKNG